MANIKHVMRDLAPGIYGDVLFTALNVAQYRLRHSGSYPGWRDYYRRHLCSDSDELEWQQLVRLREFLAHCRRRSAYFRNVLSDVDVERATPAALRELPVLEKAELIANVDQITTTRERDGVISMTGGTTGNSMKVIYAPEDMQERFAFVDTFREQAGYRLGSRIAWATGKEIVSNYDAGRGRFFRRDLKNRILFLSTFHLTDRTFDAYWDELLRVRPEFLLGFPSFFYELGVFALRKGLSLNGVSACFPTAETVTPDHRTVISKVFGCRVLDQYASSEGAPFIVECKEGRLHLQPHTGIFEVVDEAGRPARAGELIVTSFSTRGTPLLRYRIGDSLTLASDHVTCPCGFGGPVVDRIDGRKADFIVTPSGAKISSVNLSNATKGVKGIELYQVQQHSLGEIVVRVVSNSAFSEVEEARLIAALKARVGFDMQVGIQRVDSIERERSGKFRVVKSSVGSSA